MISKKQALHVLAGEVMANVAHADNDSVDRFHMELLRAVASASLYGKEWYPDMAAFVWHAYQEIDPIKESEHWDDDDSAMYMKLRADVYKIQEVADKMGAIDQWRQDRDER